MLPRFLQCCFGRRQHSGPRAELVPVNMSSHSRNKTRSQTRSSNSATSTSAESNGNNNQTPYVNEGLARWNQGRREWTAKPVKYKPPSPETVRRREDNIDPDDLYTELISPQYRPFPERVPLSYLICVLLDVWEEVSVIHLHLTIKGATLIPLTARFKYTHSFVWNIINSAAISSLRMVCLAEIEQIA